ncbi:hypothetical protein AXW74_15665 [Sphingobium sp. AM]|uniref:Uncharacterized protein n=2 Tax=Sphingobium TaxID=165695 RepID=A0A0M3AH31_9SPHN|nr:hypothetical protein YP76_25775 [Sphingobium chungbukense]KXU30821.1 hypothetical protein AXW74_15665 [Sphingobium sp. AM]GAY24751.1 hypothetical protein SFOMI_5336 [Sphingobium fuliginis]
MLKRMSSRDIDRQRADLLHEGAKSRWRFAHLNANGGNLAFCRRQGSQGLHRAQRDLSKFGIDHLAVVERADHDA